MPIRPIPLFVYSGVLLTLGAVLVFASFVTVFEVSDTDRTHMPPSEALPQALHLKPVATQNVILQRSIFEINRSQYSPPVVQVPPEPLPVRREVDISLIGISVIAGAPSATVLLDGREVQVSIGDVTNAGEVIVINNNEVVFSGDVERRVGLFD